MAIEYGRARKGLFNVEYLTVLILFIMCSMYFVFRMMAEKPAYINEVHRETLRAESYRLSEMLVDDAGAPANWQNLAGTPQQSNIKRVGLSDESNNVTNMVSETKLSEMKQMCVGAGGYATVKSMVGARHDFSLTRIDSAGVADTICSPAAAGDVTASITRLVAFDTGGYGQLITQMW
ncbi:MAG: hypothetical protein NT016_02405 [Candidatus Aenigmarchaeota archaeon]|nr:hypothetical protein [Candidatus Aenigmarchaeota archaeon]